MIGSLYTSRVANMEIACKCKRLFWNNEFELGIIGFDLSTSCILLGNVTALSYIVVGPRSILWGHYYPLLWTSDDSAHGFQIQGGLIVPALFCCLHAIIPRVISGCQDWASNPYFSPMGPTRYHSSNLAWPPWAVIQSPIPVVL